jgi:large subunit ribosomal protein L21
MSVAVISLGGKQYTVTPGKIIDVPHLAKEVGETFEVADLLGGQKVSAKVVAHHKGDKLRVVKFKNKTRYTRTIGHRSNLTQVAIDTIAA